MTDNDMIDEAKLLRQQIYAEAGRERRDKFAVAVLSAIADLDDHTPEQIARYAYEIADAMLKERENPS